MTNTVLSEIKDQVGYLTLNRPEKYNAFNRAMALGLQDLLDQYAGDDAVRCIVITGAGKAFSAGQDLAEVVDPQGPGMDKILSEQFNPIIRKIRAAPKPVLALVNGVAAGAGANIALCCDITLAAASAKFIQAFSKIGLIPDSGGTYFLPRHIGLQKATALMMFGDAVPADEAEKMGMIFRSFPDESFMQEATTLAKKLASMPTKALGFTKEVLQDSLNNSLEQQLSAEDKYQQLSAATKDFEEGVAAFIEKRSPTFTGK